MVSKEAERLGGQKPSAEFEESPMDIRRMEEKSRLLLVPE